MSDVLQQAVQCEWHSCCWPMGLRRDNDNGWRTYALSRPTWKTLQGYSRGYRADGVETKNLSLHVSLLVEWHRQSNQILCRRNRCCASQLRRCENFSADEQQSVEVSVWKVSGVQPPTESISRSQRRIARELEVLEGWPCWMDRKLSFARWRRLP